MSAVRRRGRPQRSELENRQIEVARHFEQFRRLRIQFESEICHKYPTLTIEQQRELRHTIFGSAEEFRIWSDIDNHLLSLQRSSASLARWSQTTLLLSQLFEQLLAIYHLIAKSAPDINSLKPLFSQAYFEHAVQYDISLAIQGELHLFNSDEQTTWLCGLLKYIQLQLKQPSPMSVDEIKHLRSLIRPTLRFVLHHRLGLLYRAPKESRPGRPSIPLPVLLLRAEDTLLSSHADYTKTATMQHIRPLPPEELWRQHNHYLKHQSAGRKRLSLLEKHLKQKLNLELALLVVEESVKPASNRGRKPLTADQKRRRLASSLYEVNQVLEQLYLEAKNSGESALQAHNIASYRYQSKLINKALDNNSAHHGDITQFLEQRQRELTMMHDKLEQE